MERRVAPLVSCARWLAGPEAPDATAARLLRDALEVVDPKALEPPDPMQDPRVRSLVRVVENCGAAFVLSGMSYTLRHTYLQLVCHEFPKRRLTDSFGFKGLGREAYSEASLRRTQQGLQEELG